jgi:ribonucleoside-diphosphate reductase alpha chain
MTDKFSPFAKAIMEQKYAHEIDGEKETWEQVAHRVAHHVMHAVHAPKALVREVEQAIAQRKFMPGGRYLYASGRPFHQVQNCLMLRAEDSREGWADLMHKITMSLMTGAGIGVDYSEIRAKGKTIRKTGGQATGPTAVMQMVNEAGRGIMQGGSRRCLPTGTRVTMGDYSYKSIEDVRVGDEVLTRFGRKRVTGWVNQGVQPLVNIVTECGAVTSSRDHRWLSATPARTKTFTTVAQNISLAHKLYAFHTPKSGGRDYDTQHAYLLGFYLGNGCAYSSNRTHEVSLQVAKPRHNHAQVSYLCDAMTKLQTNPVVRRGHGEVTEVRCRSKHLVEVFQQFKSPHQPFTVPQEILDASLPARYAFLAGWFDADGYYGGDSWKVSNKHPSVRNVLAMFLFDCGFLSTPNGDELRLCNYQHNAWRENVVPFAFKKPRGAARSGTNEIPADVIRVSDAGEGQTYDIEVEGHEFIADGFVSHNSAIWAGLRWNHPDCVEFVQMKNWPPEVRALKEKDFNFPAAMDGTNISVLLDDDFFKAFHNEKNRDHALAQTVYWAVVRQMLKTAEPGFSVDVGANAGETLRNACTELTSRDDSDICNLGSINMARIESLEEMEKVVDLATKFLLAGTVYSDVPYPKVDSIRTKNRRLGLGLMGLHEWLLLKGKRYGADDDLAKYLDIYATSTDIARKQADEWEISRPKKTRAIAPTGTIGIVAETTTGTEPIFCVAYKRRYLKGNVTHYQYVVDPTAQRLIDNGVDPETIEDAYSLAENVERRVAFQVWLQGWVDHAISSTINLPAWGSEHNNEQRVRPFGEMLMKHLPKLRGITCYPDGARGGQPLTPVRHQTAVKHVGEVFVEGTDVCDVTRSGSCGA